MEHLRFTPELIEWWQRLTALPERLGRVHAWRASDHPPRLDGPVMHQHHTTTLVACLRGAVRVEGGAGHLDLRERDALLIQAGTWHGHATLRPGSVWFGQGFMGGRSDYILQSAATTLASSVPSEPSSRLMEHALKAKDEGDRRKRTAELLRTVVAERSEPLAAPHPALPLMEMALWNHLHQPGGAELVLRASGLGRTRAYRLFTEHWGMPPYQALREERLRLARALLAESMTVAEVAARCGFASRVAFTRAYKRRFAQPPSAE